MFPISLITEYTLSSHQQIFRRFSTKRSIVSPVYKPLGKTETCNISVAISSSVRRRGCTIYGER